MESPEGQGWHQPAGSFEALANALFNVRADQQPLLTPALQLLGALLQLNSAAPQQDHATNTFPQQALQFDVWKLPLWVATLLVA